MKKNLEEIFKESLGKHEMPYDPSAWSAVKNQLPKSTLPYGKIGLIAAAVAALVTVAVVLFTEPNATVLTLPENPVFPSTQPADQLATIEVDKKTTDNASEAVNHGVQYETVAEKQGPPVEPSQSQQSTNNTSEQGIEKTTDANGQNGAIEPSNSLTPKPDKWLREAQLATINVSAQTICLGDVVRLHIKDLPENTLVEWTLFNGQTKFGPSISVEPASAETISAKLINKLNTKSTIQVPAERIDVLTPQEFMIAVTEDIKNTKPYFIVENKNHQIQHTSWSMDVVKSKGNQLEFYLVDQGSYTYNVTGVDQNGCKVDKKATVTLNKAYNLFAPTGFSPNGDGINETFIPVALLSRDVEFKMTIVDRSGNTVYETIDQHQPWDGTMLNGQRAQIGNNFMWVVTLINEEGLPEKYSGTIVIVK
jgi:gliding motility-associated-like protein